MPQACTGSAVPPGARKTRKRASTADMCAYVVLLRGCHPQLPVFFYAFAVVSLRRTGMQGVTVKVMISGITQYPQYYCYPAHYVVSGGQNCIATTEARSDSI